MTNFFKFFSITLFISSLVLAKGDLAIRAKKLELKLGSDTSDYDMSQKVFEMETGKAYRLEISSMGFKEYEIEAEDFFRNIWVRSCLLYTSPSPRDLSTSRMPSSA